jgi:hypothetical protein
MGEAITNVIDIAALLALVKMSCKHSIKVTKVFSLDFTVIRHLYHGIHVKVGQFEVPKHVLAF